MRETERNLMKCQTAALPQWLLTLQVGWPTCQRRDMSTGTLPAEIVWLTLTGLLSWLTLE